jgi:hypothetical protein
MSGGGWPGSLAGGFNWGPSFTQSTAPGANDVGHGINSDDALAATQSAVGQVNRPDQQAANYAQAQAQAYAAQQKAALGLRAPTIANASQAQLNQSRGQLAGIAAGYAKVPNTAAAQYQQALGQSLASNVAAAHSAMGGAVGGAGAMRAAQQAGAQATAGAAGQEGMNYANQQMESLAGQAGAYGQLSNLNLSQYGTAQQIAQEQALIKQQQMGQNEGYATNLGSAAANQQQIANQSIQSLGGLGVQAGLGEAGTAVGAQNAQTNQIGMVGSIGGAGANALAGGLSTAASPSPPPVPSDVNAKQSVQSEGSYAGPSVGAGSSAVGKPQMGTNESTVASSNATTGQLAGGAIQGAVEGAAKGTGIGASIGSIIPGIGNAIGAVIGGAAGGIAGGVTGAQGVGRNVTGVSSPQGGFQPGGQSAFSPSAGGLAQAGVQGVQDAASIASDERLKFQEQTGRASQADQFMDHLHPYSFQYKNPGDEPRDPTGGRYLGVMAQDVERAPEIGHQVVEDTPTGKKISVGAGLSAALASVGRLNERVGALESAYGGGGDEDDMGARLNESINPTRKGGGGARATTASSLAAGIAKLEAQLKALKGRAA